MADPVRLTPADARRVPWRNGRGVTEELVVWPPGATFERGDFDVRISRAGVADPGPFSAFPGFDRVLVVTRGAGLALSHGDAGPPMRVERLVPYAFSGDRPTTAALPDGPVDDFNVIVRRGRAQAAVRTIVLEGASEAGVTWGPAPGCVAAHVVTGRVRCVGRDGADLGRLDSGDTLWLADHGETSGGWTIVAERAGDGGRAEVLSVRVRTPVPQ